MARKKATPAQRRKQHQELKDRLMVLGNALGPLGGRWNGESFDRDGFDCFTRYSPEQQATYLRAQVCAITRCLKLIGSEAAHG